jgi:hypothetical protein
VSSSELRGTRAHLSGYSHFKSRFLHLKASEQAVKMAPFLAAINSTYWGRWCWRRCRPCRYREIDVPIGTKQDAELRPGGEPKLRIPRLTGLNVVQADKFKPASTRDGVRTEGSTGNLDRFPTAERVAEWPVGVIIEEDVE